MNKDQWYNVLEFSRTVNSDLSNYDEDGACKSEVFMYCNHSFLLWSLEFLHCSFTCYILGHKIVP